jgi:cysteine desulfurase
VQQARGTRQRLDRREHHEDQPRVQPPEGELIAARDTREESPMHRAYLDNNATSPLLPEVFEAMLPCFREGFGNPSSPYSRGQQARAALEQARGQVARLLGAASAEIVFTSGGTEGDNLALFGLVSPGDHVVTSAIEHRAVLNACRRLEALGAQVTYLKTDGQGQVDPDDVRAALQPSTRLISVMTANNETGVLQPVEEIGRIAAEADVWFHTDAVQATGKVPVDVNRIGCDLLTVSGHKLHAPQGIGALYVRKGTPLQPLLHGGSQELGRRPGTENLAGTVGLGKAAELAAEWLAAGGAQRMAALRDRLERAVMEQVELTRVNGGSAPRVPNTSSLVFQGVAGRGLVAALDLRGISASTGSACSSGLAGPPYPLLVMGLRPDEAVATVRFSLGKQTTSAEIDAALEWLPAEVLRLRALGPKRTDPPRATSATSPAPEGGR